MSNLITIDCLPTTGHATPTPKLAFNQSTFKSRSGLGLIHLNIRSLARKMDHVKALVVQSQPDVLALSESWLTRGIDDSDIAIPGFNTFRIDRVKKGGGVVVYTRSALSVSVLEMVSKPKCFELLALKIHQGPSSFNLVCVYRPPSAESEAIALLANLLARYSDTELLVVGDLNLNWLGKSSERLKEISASLNLTQFISEPTRPNPKDHSKGSLIDLLFSNRADRIVASGVFELGISDHCPIACVRLCKIPRSQPRIVTKRNLKHFDEHAFLDELSNSNLHSISEFSDPSEALHEYS